MADGKVQALLLRKSPIFIKKLESKHVYEGTRFEFMCQVEHQPNLNVNWIKDGRSSLPDKYQTSRDGDIYKLWCENAMPNDAGRYVCVVGNEFGEKRSMASLVVQKRIHQSHCGETKGQHQQKILDLSKVTFVDESLKCSGLKGNMSGKLSAIPVQHSTGVQDITFLTARLEAPDSKNIPSSSLVTIDAELPDKEKGLPTEHQSVALELTHANNREDVNKASEHICSSGGKSSEVPEVLQLHPEDLHVIRGSSISLTASFWSSSYDLRVKWFRGATEIIPDERVCISTGECTSTLNIPWSLPSDSECYTVFIESEFGSDQLSSSVTVEDIPEPPFGQPAVTSVTSNSLVLSWYGPVFDGGSPLLGYKIEQLQLSGGHEVRWTTINEDCQHTTSLVTNLVGDARYTFRISCRNKHGFSQPGMSCEAVLTEKCLCERSTNTPRRILLNPNRSFSDEYELGRELGRGKFGVVQECVERFTNQKFAAKVIKVKRDTVVNFRNEVDVMNQLHHPKLLQLWDAFEDRKEAILVTELIKGQELLERITTDQYTLTEGDCVYYTRQICEGVNYMHNKSIIHLDLKLENILCLDEHSKEIKIIDFGLSRVYRAGKGSQAMAGTPEFVAPEVLNYDPISPLSDMWSIGVIVYILLSGFSPFAGDTDNDTLCNVTRALYDFEEGFDAVSEMARQFITSLLKKNPKLYYSHYKCVPSRINNHYCLLLFEIFLTQVRLQCTCRERMTSLKSLQHDWLCGQEADKMSTKLSTLQHKRFLNKKRWQKSVTALRAVSRLTGDSNISPRPRGMSVDRKTFLTKLFDRNPSRDHATSDCVFDHPSPTTPKDWKRSGSLENILERRKSKSVDSLTDHSKKALKHTAVGKVSSYFGSYC